MTKNMRDSMIIYRSFYEAIKGLDSKEDQATVWEALYSYALDFKEIELSGMPKVLFTLIKPQLDSNIAKYKNGLIPKGKQEASKTEAKQKQTISKPQGNVNDNENYNENINDIITINDLELIEKSRLGGKTYKDGLKDLYELNEYQFNLGLNEWKLMNEVTEFKDEGHLKRSLNLHIKNNSQVLKAHKQERSSVSKIQNNQW